MGKKKKNSVAKILEFLHETLGPDLVFLSEEEVLRRDGLKPFEVSSESESESESEFSESKSESENESSDDDDDDDDDDSSDDSTKSYYSSSGDEVEFSRNPKEKDIRSEEEKMEASVIDGLNPLQRKIFHWAFHHSNNFYDMEVSQIVDYVAKHYSSYTSQPPLDKESLSRTIIAMAHHFVGSNNLNLFKSFGNFGSRLWGGKDHSARLDAIDTNLTCITRCLFRADDNNILPYRKDDVNHVEPPDWYMPVIPLALVNGGNGHFPPYNPRDIIANVRRKLHGKPFKSMVPWFRHFKGTILPKFPRYVGFKGKPVVPLYRRVNGAIVQSARGKNVSRYVAYGVIIEPIDEQQPFRITELPPRVWTEEYLWYLQSLTNRNPEAKEVLIESFKKKYYYDWNIIGIRVRLKKDKMPISMLELMKKLKLTRTLKTDHMVLYNAKGGAQTYKNTKQIMREFFKFRMLYYKKRKDHMMETLSRQLVLLEELLLGLSNKKPQLIIDALVKLLKQEGIEPVPRESKSAEPQFAAVSSEEQESDHAIDVLKLEAIKQAKSEEFKSLSKESPKSLWMKDLVELEKKLDELDGMGQKKRKCVSANVARAFKQKNNNSLMVIGNPRARCSCHQNQTQKVRRCCS
ncbi:hypothetical protein RIF29_07144 [Crotalaria pallida]|uniref:DNA topoisomerase (ATP-hydrolyzing) n=1 Tax=Crotalaria pallida TaxID=3830 RepID=A0AAN9PB98_CROPI